jgi:hypothetical protein
MGLLKAAASSGSTAGPCPLHLVAVQVLGLMMETGLAGGQKVARCLQQASWPTLRA